jgi:hypothetical protein
MNSIPTDANRVGDIVCNIPSIFGKFSWCGLMGLIKTSDFPSAPGRCRLGGRAVSGQLQSIKAPWLFFGRGSGDDRSTPANFFAKDCQAIVLLLFAGVAWRGGERLPALQLFAARGYPIELIVLLTAGVSHGGSGRLT